MEETGYSRNGRKTRPVEGEARDRGGAEGQSLPKMCLGAMKHDDAMTCLLESHEHHPGRDSLNIRG